MRLGVLLERAAGLELVHQKNILALLGRVITIELASETRREGVEAGVEAGEVMDHLRRVDHQHGRSPLREPLVLLDEVLEMQKLAPRPFCDLPLLGASSQVSRLRRVRRGAPHAPRPVHEDCGPAEAIDARSQHARGDDARAEGVHLAGRELRHHDALSLQVKAVDAHERARAA